MKRQTLLIVILTIAFISCQQVNIENNEVGVHFKKFGGGVDTTSYLDTGKHSISNWDRVIKYSTSLNSNSVDYLSENNINYKIIYSYSLAKENVALYHRYYGGIPKDYSERAINELIMDNGIENIFESYKSGRNEIFKSALNIYYIDLNDIQINKNEK